MKKENIKNSNYQELENEIEIGEKETHVALLNILEDIEEARARAVEEKNKTLAIITNFTDGLLLFDKGNRLLLINPVAEKILELESAKVINKSLSGITGASKLKLIMKPLKTFNKKVFREEVQINKDLTLELSTVPVTRERETIGTLVILHDITREKLVEQMKTEFVSLAAHQLRTPLSAIKWTLRMILDGDLGKITKEQTDFLEKTYSSNERMIDLINDLLNVTRIEEGRYLSGFNFFQFEELLEEIINNYKNEIKRKDIILEVEKPEKKMPTIKADVEKVKLAVSNLLDNAVRYTLSGGKIKIVLNFDKEKISFSIKDSGIGVPEDQQKRLFAKFFRGANAIRIETEGSGLGLFIAKNIIEAHGGKIGFGSEENKGSTFYFDLPIKAQPR